MRYSVTQVEMACEETWNFQKNNEMSRTIEDFQTFSCNTALHEIWPALHKICQIRPGIWSLAGQALPSVYTAGCGEDGKPDTYSYDTHIAPRMIRSCVRAQLKAKPITKKEPTLFLWTVPCGGRPVKTTLDFQIFCEGFRLSVQSCCFGSNERLLNSPKQLSPHT